MQRRIATSQPIKHGNRVLSKSIESLNRLLTLDQLPITDEHSDTVLGHAKNFMIRVRNGITEVLADIPNTLNTSNKGFSLQFSGALIDPGVIDVSQYHHLALTSNPRDSLTFSESSDTEVKVEEPVNEAANDDPKPQNTSTDLTSEQILKLLETPEIKDRLLKILNVQVEQEHEPATESAQSETPATDTESTAQTSAQQTEQVSGSAQSTEQSDQVKEPVIKVLIKPQPATPPKNNVREKPRLTVTQYKFPSI